MFEIHTIGLLLSFTTLKTNIFTSFNLLLKKKLPCGSIFKAVCVFNHDPNPRKFIDFPDFQCF